MKRYLILLLVLNVMGCAAMEESAGKVLENAGSAIRTGDPKIWGKPEGYTEQQSKNYYYNPDPAIW